MRPEDGITRRRLYLVRHGHVDYFDKAGRAVDPRSVLLSSTGEIQVAALKESLKNVVFDWAVSSSYPRAVQTLEGVLASVPLSGTLEKEPAFREIRAGRLRDMPKEAYTNEVSGAYQYSLQPNAQFLRGETWASFSERVISKLRQRLVHDRNWTDGLIVSHDAVNRVILSWLVGEGRNLVPIFEQDPACLNIIDVELDRDRVTGALIRLINHTPYDQGKRQNRSTVMERIAESMLNSALR